MKVARARHHESQIDLFTTRPVVDVATPATDAARVDRTLLVVGDISAEHVDAIVCPANPSLKPGDVVERAIRRTAGRELETALTEIRSRSGGCRTGHVVVTAGFLLQAKHVIHAVAPRFRGGAHDEDALLAHVYREALHAAREIGARTVAFPPLSTGALAFPDERAASIALATIDDVLSHALDVFSSVRFVLPDGDALAVWKRVRDARHA